jgi:RNA polymerase sigma factor (sigma-70 family)
MPDPSITSIFQGLRSSRSREVWAEFLRQYSPVIFQTCRYATSDADQAAECFVFACEQLSRNNFRRLLRFPPEGPAGFSAWLRVVVRNLCLDWRRKEFGRPRLFRSIARLTQLDTQVYRCRYECGLSLEATLASLRPNFPGLTMEQLAAAEEQVQESLNSRQLWLMSTRKAYLRMQAQESRVGVIEAPANEPADPRPNQESAFAAREEEDRLQSALGKLPKPERLLLRMRFEQGLSLEEIGGLVGLGDAQRVHRRIADILEKLRYLICEKSRTVSVK